MPRRNARPGPERTIELTSCIGDCPECGRKLGATIKPSRVVVTLEGLVRLRLQVRSCRNPECPRFKACLRPEGKGRFALPQQEFGLDVIALAGRPRHGERLSVPEIHAELARRGGDVCERSVGTLVDGYDVLLDLACVDPKRLRTAVAAQGRAILGIDGL